MVVSDTIYKRTSTGKVQQWAIQVEGNKFRTISGKTDGKKTTSEWTECFGKNLGKSNETTDEEQANAEAIARFDKQLEKHYFRDIADVDEVKFVKAMLAHNYDDKFKGSFPIYSQPKLDGMRCLVSKAGLFSRSGKHIHSSPHIFEAVKSLFDKNPNLVLDGELYNHALREDFEELISLARKSKPKPEDLDASSKMVQLHIYDAVIAGGFEIRQREVEQMVKEINDPMVIFVQTDLVGDQGRLDELYEEYMGEGFEGQMIRDLTGKYEGKRSKFLLKRKEFKDEEFTVVSMNEGKGNYSGMIKSVTVTDGEHVFDSGIKGSQEFLKKLTESADEYIGTEVTIRYQNKSTYGIPRFPVAYYFWKGKRNA